LTFRRLWRWEYDSIQCGLYLRTFERNIMPSSLLLIPWKRGSTYLREGHKCLPDQTVSKPKG